MRSLAVAALVLAVTPAAFAANSIVALTPQRVEKIRNEKVIVTEETLARGAQEKLPADLPSAVVYMNGGTVEITPAGGAAHKSVVKEGETDFQPPQAGVFRNAGKDTLHFVRIVFLTPGSPETWGATGLSPHYVVLLENQYLRAYDIKIPAQTYEPRHTHHDRIVVSLSGAQLEHILPDGKIQPSTLKTGEIVWRLGGTHTGHNIGHTDLWVIAVEPK